MLGIIVVLAFPLLTAVGYGTLLQVYRALGGAAGAARLERDGFYFYPLFLLVPLAVVLAVPGSRGRLWDGIGLGAQGWLAAPIAIGAAAAGAALFLADKSLSNRLAASTSDERPLDRLLLEGKTDSIASFRPRLWVLSVLTFAVVAVEEALWRGYLLTAVPAELRWTSGAALALAAVAYGINHYYFGLSNVALKAAHGAIWGSLYLATGSLIAPLASHLTFDALVAAQPTVRQPA